MKQQVLIINGPNLNLLGSREPEKYGQQTFDQIFETLKDRFPDLEFSYFQSNWEGGIIDKLHESEGKFIGVVLNAGGFTHTSIAIRDAISAIETPVVEVHISNLAKREEFRHTSVLAPVCLGAISGFGADSYRLGVEALLR